MLSNPTSVYQRQRLHQRQKSTPAAFEAPTVPELPTTRRNMSHRRGMSLDERARRQSPSQDKKVSTSNKGFRSKQQILRETQQQRLVRPGKHERAPNFKFPDNKNHLISPLSSPQKQISEMSCQSLYGELHEPALIYSPYHEPAIITESDNFAGADQFSGNDYILFPESGNITSPAYLNFPTTFADCIEQDWAATVNPKRASRRVSGGIADRVAKFESMATEQPDLRPVTPQAQNSENYFLPTPDATPFTTPFTAPFPTPFGRSCQDQELQETIKKYQDSFEDRMEETLKPIRNKDKQQAKNIFQEMRDHVEMNVPLSPPGTIALQTQCPADSAKIPKASLMDLSSLNMDLMKSDTYESPYHVPMGSTISPGPSQHSSPEASQMTQFDDLFSTSDSKLPSDLQYQPASQNNFDSHQSRRRSPHNRSLSVDSINLEETITETGITGEDIACYIDGPDPVDQKWLCLYPDCKKRFGRKENIRSHVQTHLGDRQYQCPHCKKCFVRQHDLKRHAKIHSGVKPYPCLCGNSFARHDALTRHRQRGMCIGAFEGVVKKIVKRGRPRKARPGVEERLDKAFKTRNKKKSASSASSTSGISDRSLAQTPPGDLEILDQAPFGDITCGTSKASTVVEGGGFQWSAENSPMKGDCVSPQDIQSAPSPSALSAHSQSSYYPPELASHRGSITDISEQHSQYFSSQPSSPAKSHVNYHPDSFTPPELYLSLSSPPLSSKFCDLPSQSDNQDVDLSRFASFCIQTDNEDDMFLDAFESQGMGLSRLEEDPSILLKYENPFDAVEAIDGGGGMLDDVFFGSP